MNIAGQPTTGVIEYPWSAMACGSSVDCLVVASARRMSSVTRNRFAGQPFEDSDEVIARALEDVSIPALMASLVHMSGDPSWVRGEIQPNVAMSLDIQGAM